MGGGRHLSSAETPLFSTIDFYSGRPKAQLQFADEPSYCVRDFSDDKIYFIEPLVGLKNPLSWTRSWLVLTPPADRHRRDLRLRRLSPFRNTRDPIGTLDVCFLSINAVQHSLRCQQGILHALLQHRT